MEINVVRNPAAGAEEQIFLVGIQRKAAAGGVDNVVCTIDDIGFARRQADVRELPLKIVILIIAEPVIGELHRAFGDVFHFHPVAEAADVHLTQIRLVCGHDLVDHKRAGRDMPAAPFLIARFCVGHSRGRPLGFKSFPAFIPGDGMVCRIGVAEQAICKKSIGRVKTDRLPAGQREIHMDLAF